MKKNNKVLNIIKIIWGVAVVAGGIYYVIKNYTTAIQYLSNISPWKLLLATVFIVLVRLMNVDMVQQSLVRIGWKPTFRSAFSFVSVSQLGKYIPGGVWQFVARFEAYKEANITYKNMGKAFIIENVWRVIGCILISAAFILFSQPVALLAKYDIDLSPHLMFLLAATLLVLWLLTVVICEFVFRQKDQPVSISRVIYIFISQITLWFFYGISFFCLFSKAGTFSDLLFTTGAISLSFIAGYVVVIAPGGIGVREAVTILLFSWMFSSSEIGIYAIVHRLLFTIAEFLLAGIAVLLNRKKKAAEHPNLEDSQNIN